MKPRLFTLIGLCLVAAGCADAPFARSNVNDPGAQFSGRLVLSRDTVSPANPYVAAQVVMDPVAHGYEPVWSATGNRLSVLGAGVFYLLPSAAGPPVPSVEIRATFLSQTLTATVYIATTP